MPVIHYPLTANGPLISFNDTFSQPGDYVNQEDREVMKEGVSKITTVKYVSGYKGLRGQIQTQYYYTWGSFDKLAVRANNSAIAESITGVIDTRTLGTYAITQTPFSVLDNSGAEKPLMLDLEIKGGILIINPFEGYSGINTDDASIHRVKLADGRNFILPRQLTLDELCLQATNPTSLGIQQVPSEWDFNGKPIASRNAEIYSILGGNLTS